VAFVTVLLAVVTGAVVPFRYLIASGVVASMVQKGALAEKRSSSIQVMSKDPALAIARQCGIEFGASEIAVVCISKSAGSLSVPGGTPIPRDWLPGGKKGPCTYLLQINQPASIKTLYGTTDGVPGVTGPLKVTLKASSCWENLGCDPITKDFFINE
jgi:hypothetical protein